MTRRLLISAACALALAVLAAPAAAQEEPPAPTRHCTGGPFTLTSGTVRFHVAVDDVRGAAASRVTMRLYDAQGIVVASRTVNIGVNRTATLEYKGTGLLRAQATVDTAATLSPRRKNVGSVEVLDIDNLKLIVPVSCGIGEYEGGGR